MGKAARILFAFLLAAIPRTAQTVNTCTRRAPTRTIDAATYSFTGQYLAEELSVLARKGVRILVYRDRERFAQETQSAAGTATGILLAAGVECRVKGARDLMHLKSYAIDGRLLRTGSANWSPTGLKRQDYDVLYESSPEAGEGFERKFEEMWARASNTGCKLEH